MKINYLTILFFALFLFSSCKKDIVIFDSLADENLDLPLLLNFNNKACALDIKTNSFRFPIDQANISDFSAFIEFQEHAEITFNGITLNNGGVNNLGDIEINKAYPLEIEALGETNTFDFYFSSLPIVQLTTHDGIRNEPKIYGKITVNYTNAPSLVSFIGVEVRGVSSLQHPKKSYGFMLLQNLNMENEQSLSFFNKATNNKWILDAMYIDEAKGRNKTCLEVWQSFPNNIEHLGTTCEYVELFLNYESQGIYSFCESLTEEFLSLNAESVLITGKINKEHTYFRAVPPGKPNGPYWGGWEQKFPDVDDGNNWDAFKELSKLVAKGSDQAFINEISSQIDLENFIDYFIYVNIFKAYDDVGKNWFLLKKSNTEKFVVVPWDLDFSWGRDWLGNKYGYEGTVSNGLYDRLLELNPNNYKQSLKNRWENLKNNELSPNALMNIFDANFDELNQSNIIAIDNQIWDKNTELTAERAYINSWIANNWNYFDSYISSL